MYDQFHAQVLACLPIGPFTHYHVDNTLYVIAISQVEFMQIGWQSMGVEPNAIAATAIAAQNS